MDGKATMTDTEAKALAETQIEFCHVPPGLVEEIIAAWNRRVFSEERAVTTVSAPATLEMAIAYIAAYLHRELSDALAAHSARSREPSSGVYHFKAENDAIGRILERVDPFLFFAGLWPVDRRYIGNDERLRLLERAASPEPGQEEAAR